MGRLKCLLLAGALAVAVAAIAAGPASAAKGGKRANAHACQHGGHKTLFEAQTGHPTGPGAGRSANSRVRPRAPMSVAGSPWPPRVQNAVWQCVNFLVPPNERRPVELANACDVDAGLGANLVSFRVNFAEAAFTAVRFNG
jgi:hypothetical protein